MFTFFVLTFGWGSKPDDAVIAWAILADLLLLLILAIAHHQFALIDTCTPKE